MDHTHACVDCDLPVPCPLPGDCPTSTSTPANSARREPDSKLGSHGPPERPTWAPSPRAQGQHEPPGAREEPAESHRR